MDKIAFKMKTMEESREHPLVSKINSNNFMLDSLTISFLWVTHISTNFRRTGKVLNMIV